MLACDLDGTLLMPDGSLSPRTLAALDAARDSGLLVAMVTGRPPRWLSPVVHQSGWHGLAVAANGAVIADLNVGRVMHTFPIDTDVVHETVTRLRKSIPGVAFAVEHIEQGQRIPDAPPDLPFPLLRSVGPPAEFGHEPGYQPRLPVAPHTPIGVIDELIASGNVVKLLARAPADSEHDADETMQRAQDELAELVTVTHSSNESVLLEISKIGISKGTGVSWLANEHNIDQSDVIAVGDMPNDIPMLQWAGQGYAMGNAHQLVRDSVGPEHVVPPNTDDGVAQLIESLLHKQ